MVWTSTADRSINAELKHVYDSFSFCINLKWTLVTIRKKELTYLPMQETLKNFKIEFTSDEGEKIILFDNALEIDNDDETQNRIYHAEDGYYRYLLTSGQGGKITWQYTYRNVTFLGEREITAGTSGTRYIHHETADMGELPGRNMQISDFYCSVDTGEVDNPKIIGYVFPWDAAIPVNEANKAKEKPFADHHCIGLVIGIGQHENDGWDYTQSCLVGNKCNGYVMALTQATDALAWASENSAGASAAIGTNHHIIKSSRTLVDWNGFYNYSKIIKFAANPDNKTDLKDFPAAYACETYGVKCGLSAPTNTTGWFLPSLGMMYFAWRTKDNVETASKQYDEISALLKERFATIKEYLKYDAVYTDNNYTYEDEIKGFDETGGYWSSNEANPAKTSALMLSFSAVENYPKTTTTITSNNEPIKVKPFLVF